MVANDDGEQVASEKILSKDDGNAENSECNATKIKIHRKRSIQPSSVYLLEEAADSKLSVEKADIHCSSFSDLIEIGADGEVLSTEKGKGQIARKLTFGRETIDQFHKGAFIPIVNIYIYIYI